MARQAIPAPAGMRQADLHAILDLARAAGVRSIHIDGIAYSFVRTNVELPASPATGPAASREDVSATPGAPETGPTAEAPKSLLTTADIEALRNAEEAQQLIEDPAGFEQTQIDAHLTAEQPLAGEAAH